MNQSDEFSEAFENLASPFVKSPAVRRCRCQPRGKRGVESANVRGAEGSEETTWSGEDEMYLESEPQPEVELDAEDEQYEAESSGVGEFEDAETTYEDEEVEAEALPADFQARIAAVAAQEWQRWGQGSNVETDQGMEPPLRAYWAAAGFGRKDIDTAIKERWYWSAAFVSYLMHAAGAGKAFKGQSAHRLYIKAAKAARAAGDGSKFQAYRINEIAPQVGDIVCRDRSANKRCAGTNYDNVDDGTERAAHCDVVIAVGQNTITTIGGNVSGPKCRSSGCTVNERSVSIDKQGRVVSRPGSCQLFAILKAPGRAAPIVKARPVAAPASVPTPAVLKASFALPSPRGYRTSGGKRRGKVRAVVVHTTGSGLAAKAEKNRRGRGRGCTTALDCGLETYARPGDGGFPHYLIAYDGTIYCTCPEDHVAWHAGWTKATGGKAAFSPDRWSAPGWWARVWSPAKSPLELVPPSASGPNSHSVGIELLGAPRPDAGYTEEQYRALARLVIDLDRRHGIGIARAPSVKLLGHEDLNPLTGEGGRADSQGGWDPGAHRPKARFSWPKLWALVEQGRTVHELGGEDENGPGDAESEFVGESLESEAPESEWEWEVANE